MTLSASPYAVFKAEEWVSAVAQPIGIAQCLRLTPKVLAPITCYVKKKSGNSLIKGFSKKHVQLSFAWHVNISIIPATSIAEQFFLVLFIVVLFLMETIWFHFVFFVCGNEWKRLACVQRWTDTLNRSIRLSVFPCDLWSAYEVYLLYWLALFLYLVFDFLSPTWYVFIVKNQLFKDVTLIDIDRYMKI